MKKIDKIWIELEEDFSTSSLLLRRYSAEVRPDIFVALRNPEKIRCIAFNVRRDNIIKENNFEKLKDLKVEVVHDDNNSKKSYLLILLLTNQFTEIFSVLCEDLIESVSSEADEKKLIERLKERLVQWQSLFEKVGREGLSEEAQRGLYGEVYFLRDFIQNSQNHFNCLRSWVGPEKNIQDFQFGNWAVEVKTTHGKNHQKIFISSERQLDDSLIGNIFIFHLSLDIRGGGENTLNSLIESVKVLLINDTSAHNLFELKLLQYGYFDNHKTLYESNSYIVRKENIYKVLGNFPRITESMIPQGVGDVKYSIILSDSEEWRVNQEILFKEIKQ
ncbi:MAG: PD-(D/E)XK motif protein [Moheibacter sp.]